MAQRHRIKKNQIINYSIKSRRIEIRSKEEEKRSRRWAFIVLRSGSVWEKHLVSDGMGIVLFVTLHAVFYLKLFSFWSFSSFRHKLWCHQ